MFRKKDQHEQGNLYSGASELPQKRREQFEKARAGTFYKELFYRIDEDMFAALFSNKDSRPNMPVNVLLGLEGRRCQRHRTWLTPYLA